MPYNDAQFLFCLCEGMACSFPLFQGTIKPISSHLSHMILINLTNDACREHVYLNNEKRQSFEKYKCMKLEKQKHPFPHPEKTSIGIIWKFHVSYPCYGEDLNINLNI